MKPTQDPLPYFQPKAELLDEQKIRHELHGERIVHEVDGEGDIFQMSDETESLVLPLQGCEAVHEMAEGNPVAWELPVQKIHEVMGHEHAQELDCPVREREKSVVVEDAHELETTVLARKKSLVLKSAHGLQPLVQAGERSKGVGIGQDFDGPAADLVRLSTRMNPSRSHGMLRQ